jgi:hypothetical protein
VIENKKCCICKIDIGSGIRIQFLSNMKIPDRDTAGENYDRHPSFPSAEIILKDA